MNNYEQICVKLDMLFLRLRPLIVYHRIDGKIPYFSMVTFHCQISIKSRCFMVQTISHDGSMVLVEKC